MAQHEPSPSPYSEYQHEMKNYVQKQVDDWIQKKKDVSPSNTTTTELVSSKESQMISLPRGLFSHDLHTLPKSLLWALGKITPQFQWQQMDAQPRVTMYMANQYVTWVIDILKLTKDLPCPKHLVIDKHVATYSALMVEMVQSAKADSVQIKQDFYHDLMKVAKSVAVELKYYSFLVSQLYNNGYFRNTDLPKEAIVLMVKLGDCIKCHYGECNYSFALMAYCEHFIKQNYHHVHLQSKQNLGQSHKPFQR